MFSSIKKIHFVGIGGIGMSGIAEILLNRGFEISGSDLNENDNTEYLRSKGAKITIGHFPENVNGQDVVVYSSAVNPDENPETLEARRQGIPVIRRAEMLAEATRLNYSIAIAGTHGKTTTTSMIGLILIKAGYDPTVIVGGRLKDFGGTNARLGKGEWTVLEADEFDRSFLQLFPSIAVINNIEPEHLDIYDGIEDLKTTFLQFANKVPFYGFVALGTDDPNVKEILSGINKKTITFGMSRNNDYYAKDIELQENFSKFILVQNSKIIGEISLNVPGYHNVKNALAAVAVTTEMGIDFSIIKAALQEFTGVIRRFDIKGEIDGIMIVDDYAHHPTEIRATLDAARKGWDRRIIAVFQPHTYSRTQEFYKEFAQAFDDADVLVITDVYAARENPIPGISGELIAQQAKIYGHKNVHYIPDFENIIEFLLSELKQGDMLITIGAGNISKISQLIKEKLEVLINNKI
ncbi:MAG TPA: UDP-N-acetylmuramate--L-alanine ligase [Candidatus Kapabacteria bacterium]|nr:UDP-N-acetylmuramate--L-alanine ligase [Candidatus Kapabacteria bacterium]